jgi:2-polyprenyl-6-methoxyphenol hydroxylase-like FAD-dependent oxidoreductase
MTNGFLRTSSGRAPHVAVVGAGIGGLAAALALHRLGWRVTVCERSPTLEPVGAGIGLTPNALRAMDVLGVGAAGRARSAPLTTGGIRRPDGRWIARSKLDFIRSRFGDPVIGMHRSALIDLMADGLPAGSIHTGVAAVGVEQGDRRRAAQLHTTAGDLAADLVVAADGIRSRLRAVLFPTHPGVAYAGYSSWRFVVSAAQDCADSSETWGNGTRFGIMQLPNGLLHCSATSVVPPRTRHADEAAELALRFGGWHEPIPSLIAATTSSEVLHHDIEELASPLPAYHRSRVVFVGDAAHAMTPNLGPACLALEDAAVLGRLVPAPHHTGLDGTALLGALHRYTAARMVRTQRLTIQSRRVGAAGQWSSPILVTVRNLGFRLGGLLPHAITGRALDAVIDWRPPPPG